MCSLHLNILCPLIRLAGFPQGRGVSWRISKCGMKSRSLPHTMRSLWPKLRLTQKCLHVWWNTLCLLRPILVANRKSSVFLSSGRLIDFQVVERRIKSYSLLIGIIHLWYSHVILFILKPFSSWQPSGQLYFVHYIFFGSLNWQASVLWTVKHLAQRFSLLRKQTPKRIKRD